MICVFNWLGETISPEPGPETKLHKMDMILLLPALALPVRVTVLTGRDIVWLVPALDKGGTGTGKTVI